MSGKGMRSSALQTHQAPPSEQLTFQDAKAKAWEGCSDLHSHMLPVGMEKRTTYLEKILRFYTEIIRHQIL